MTKRSDDMTTFQHRDLLSAPFLDLLERTINTAQQLLPVPFPYSTIQVNPVTTPDQGYARAAMKAAAFEVAGQFCPEPGEQINHSRYDFARGRFIDDMTNYLNTDHLMIDFSNATAHR